MKCPRCQHANPSKARRCVACGTGLGVRTKSRKLPVSSKAPKSEGARGRAHENRLAAALGQVQDLERQLAEAAEQQAATAEILKVISSSPNDIRPVFDTIVRSAVRLLGAYQGGIFRFDGELVHVAALASLNPEAEERLRQRFPQAPNPHTGSGRVIVEKRVFQIPDTEEFPFERQRATARDFGFRRSVWVPMIREEQVIGVLSVDERVG